MKARRLTWSAVAVVVGFGCVAASACSARPSAARPSVSLSRPAASSAGPPATHAVAAGVGSVLGVVSTNVAEFEKATGVHVNLEARYLSWGTGLPLQLLAGMESSGIVPLVEIEPRGVSLQAIAGGSQDAYIKELADDAKSLRGKLYLSFAPEMNGNWYSWGSEPALFVRAWRHVVSVFRAAKASNVSWVWIVHHVKPNAAPLLRSYWPGTGWVTWVGVDGYYEHPYESFQSMFAPSLAEMHKITNDPVLITETSVGPLAENVPAKIANLFNSVRRFGLLGLVWFDIEQADPPVHQNWNLESRPAALSAFRSAVKRDFSNLAG